MCEGCLMPELYILRTNPQKGIMVFESIRRFKTSQGLVSEINFGLNSCIGSDSVLTCSPQDQAQGRNTECVRLSSTLTLSRFSFVFLERFISLSKISKYSVIFGGHNFCISWYMKLSFKIGQRCCFVKLAAGGRLRNQ